MGKDRGWVEQVAAKVAGEIKELGQNLVRGGIQEFWNGAGPQGAHELAAAMFGQGQTSGFVMYPRGKHDDGVHGPQQDIPAQGGAEQQQQQERGGREL